MGILRFSYGTMGSGKSTLALQIHHNLAKRHRGLLLTRLDREGAMVSSRLGPSASAIEVAPETNLKALVTSYTKTGPIRYIVADEVQFFEPAQVDELAALVDTLGIDVYAFGLITDFRGKLFEGTARMLEIADERVQLHVEARCWCGERALFNARLVDGQIVYQGDVVVVGDTSDSDAQPLFGSKVTYELLCRRHYNTGETSAEQ